MNNLKVTIPTGTNGGQYPFSVQTSSTVYIGVIDSQGVVLTNVTITGYANGLFKPVFAVVYTGGCYSHGLIDVTQFTNPSPGVFVITFTSAHPNQATYNGTFPFGIVCSAYNTAAPSNNYYVTGGATGTSGNQITIWVTNSSGTLVNYPFTMSSVP